MSKPTLQTLTDRVTVLERSIVVLLARARFSDLKGSLASPIAALRADAEDARTQYEQALKDFHDSI
jgi:hypothetical protein